MEEVRNYGKFAFIKNTFENVSRGCMPRTPPLIRPCPCALLTLFANH